MKRLALLMAPFVVISASTSVSFAYFPATYARCTADPLFGHPTMTLQEERTGYGRRRWATNAHNYYKFTVNQGMNAMRYWLPNMFNPEVNDAIGADIDLYPVYVDTAHPDMPLWVGPGPNNTKWFGTTSTTIANLDFGKINPTYDLPSSVAVDAICEAGCYSPEQEILIGDAFVPVSEAHASGEVTLTTLTADAAMDSLQFMRNRIAKWTVDIAPAHQTILTLRMKSGGELRITTEHPLLTSEGVMKRAQDLVLGESLVREDGSPDPVVSMVKSTELTKVYNLRPTSTDLTSNILVAQGYLTGSARYQNEWLKYLNRVLLRHKIPSSVIPRARASRPSGAAPEASGRAS